MEKKNYGYWGTEEGRSGLIHMKKGQVIAGHTVGILLLDVWYPLLPGNVVNAYTYNFPVLYKMVKGSSVERLLGCDITLRDEILNAGRELVEQGARVVTGACGYFAHFQADLAEDLDVPVYLSSLLQFPMILRGLRRKQKIGILCANKSVLTAEMLQKVGINDLDRCAIMGLEKGKEFSKLLEGKGYWDNDGMRQEVLDGAKKLIENNEIGAILLECSDLPPYAADVQRAFNLPVFDYITMINWMHQAVSQRPYYGFI